MREGSLSCLPITAKRARRADDGAMHVARAARACSTKVLTTRVPMGPSTNWGDSAGVSRAVRIGDTIHVSGTVTKGESAGAQVRGCLSIVADAVRSAGGRGLQDVVLTRIIAADPANDLAEIAAAHKAAFADAGAEWPANTTFGGSFPRPWIRVGVEATAVVQSEPTQAPPPPPPQTPTSFAGVDISAYSRATVASRSRPDPPPPRRAS